MPKHIADHYLNRELSMLEFNRRVLAQAEDARVPLLERLRFLCIVSSNLDEFFEIRVAGLKEQIKLKAAGTDPDGMTAHQVYQAVHVLATSLVARQYQLLNQEILPGMEREGICFLRRISWNEAQSTWIKDYFLREVMPVLTPIGLDPAHPFPRVLNKSLNFVVELEGRDAFGRSSSAAIVQAPRVLPRFIRLPQELANNEYCFVFLSSILHAYVGELFSGMDVRGFYQFRVTRNSGLFVDEEEVKNLRIALQGELPQRHYGDAVRLEVAENCSPKLADFLLQQFALEQQDLYRVQGPVNLVRLMDVHEQVKRPNLKFLPYLPSIPENLKIASDIFKVMQKQDILLHHPFQSFDPVIQFLQQAASDPQVVAIKQTAYRIETNSALMEALLSATRSGKEVTVVVELLARFNEEANLNWAARLEEAGAHVIYGVVGHKTHAKMVMVVRRSKTGLRRYVHLGTGNYHAITAKSYTDFGLLTCNEQICSDVNEVFTQLTGLGRANKLNHLWQSPFGLHKHLIEAIENETECAKNKHPASIIAKMNALLEPDVIQALYRASQAGVKIQLIVRGVCALRPGMPGLSENIKVRSIVGRFLEHTRVFYFRNRGKHDVYLSSADWMDRNFFRRIELCFPVLDRRLKKRVLREGLKLYLLDNMEAWQMDARGRYRRKSLLRGKRMCAQEELMKLLNPKTTKVNG